MGVTNINPVAIHSSEYAYSGTVTVTATGGWTATPNVTWLSVTSGSPGNGNGTVGYSIAANPDEDDRIGTISIGGLSFRVDQNGDKGAIKL